MSATEHERAAELLPWLVNGSLQGAELAWLNDHLAGCAQCRDEQRHQQLVRHAVARQPVVELAPQASFKRLWARIETEANAPQADGLVTASGLPERSPRFSSRWVRIAGLAAGVAALAVVSTVVWRELAPGAGADDGYRTVSIASAPSLPGQIRVVFADTATVADIKSILAGVQLESTAGPTAAGVFTLQPATGMQGANLESITRSLRSDPRVRFAELR